MNPPTAELWGFLMSKATDVTLIYHNRSRAAGIIIKMKLKQLLTVNREHNICMDTSHSGNLFQTMTMS